MNTGDPPHDAWSDAAAMLRDARTSGSQAAITALFDGARAALFLVDTDGRIAAFNAMAAETAERHFQRRLCTGDPLLEFVPADSRDDVANAFERCVEGTPGDCVRSVAAPNGPATWFRISCRPVSARDGRIVGVACTALDVTDRIVAEEQLQSARRLEGLGRLAGGVAHDFNNVLTVIINATDLALGLAGKNRRLSNLLAEILRAAMHGSELTRQLLAFGHRKTNVHEELDLRPTVTGMTALLEPILGDRIALRITTTDVPCRVQIDATQIEQLIMNLVVNARDAMPEGGAIGIDVAVGTDEPAYVRVSITDTGVGMDGTTRSRALEPFFTTKPIGRGTGLGLAVVQGIVEQSKGHLRIESAPGVGTRVDVFIPLVGTGAMPAVDAVAVSEPSDIAHVVRPASPEGLLRRVREILDRQQRETGHRS